MLTALLAAPLLLVAACGGGGGGGGDGATRVGVDRTSVSSTFGQGDIPADLVVIATRSGDLTRDIFVGVDTPTGQADPNIQDVQLETLSITQLAAHIIPAPGLAPGNYSGTLIFLACPDRACASQYAGSPIRISYSFTVRAHVQVTPSLLIFSGEIAAPQTSQVSVVLPPGVSTYLVTPSDPSTVQIDQQTATGFRVTATPKVIGSFSSDITVNADGLIRHLTVSLTGVARPILLDVSRVDLTATSGSPAQASFNVLRNAEGATDFSVSTDGSAPWLSVSRSAGSTTQVNVSALSWPSGNWAGNILITSGSETRVLPVGYAVATPVGGERGLSVGASTLTLAAVEFSESAYQTLVVSRPTWNPQVDFTISYPPAVGGWLSGRVMPDGNFEFKAVSGLLPVGTYLAQIQFSGAAPSQPVIVPVQFSIGPGLATPAPQTYTLTSDTTATGLTGSVPLMIPGNPAISWTASSDSPWLVMDRASGDQASLPSFHIDAGLAVQANGSSSANVGSITVTARPAGAAADAPGYRAVNASITLSKALSEVQAVGPADVFAGQAASVVVRGRNLGLLADPAARLQIAGLTPTSVTRLGSESLRVQLPAHAAGNRTISVSNDLGVSMPSATLRTLDASALPAAALPTGSAVGSVLVDLRRRQVFLLDRGNASVQRWRESAGGWSARETLAFAGLADIALSQDGAWLIVAERSGRMHLVDPIAFTIAETLNLPGTLIDVPDLGRGLAVSNDGKVWFGWGSSNTSFGHLGSVDIPRRLVTPDEDTGGILGTTLGGPWLVASRDGERLHMVQSAQVTPSPPLLYRNSSDGVWRTNPAGLTFFYWSFNGLDDAASRFSAFSEVFDGSFARVGQEVLPDAGWLDVASVLSPDGRRLYVFALPPDWQNAATANLPRIYVFDTSVAAGTTNTLPLLSRFDVADFPTCHVDRTDSACFRPMMNISPDGKTLFVAGTVNLMVVPVPAQLPTVAPQGLRRKVQAAPPKAPAVMRPWRSER
ncbi:MAG: hypothetical protein RL722_2032 [Pseudomonadota bacterium]